MPHSLYRAAQSDAAAAQRLSGAGVPTQRQTCRHILVWLLLALGFRSASSFALAPDDTVSASNTDPQLLLNTCWSEGYSELMFCLSAQSGSTLPPELT